MSDPKQYTSSVVNKYGDRDNVPTDCKTIYSIIERQGTSLLVDCIAEHIGTVSHKFNLTVTERTRIIDSLLKELKEALNQRT